jgi:inorganic pyrophosphatase
MFENTDNNEIIKVYIEIEKGSNIKYEFCKKNNKLIVDRILDEPFVYPYSYGFIPNTLAEDGDELDILVLTNDELENDGINNNTYYEAYIVGCLVMEDEKGMDEKILCVLEKDYKNIKDLCDIDETTKNKIYTFFSEYKKNNIDKWSNVIGFINKELSIKLYKKSIVYEK